MEKVKIKEGFADFIKVFPEVDLPVSLTEETRHLFSMQNKPISDALVDAFILPYEEGEAKEIDEFTEFMACLKIPNTGSFHAFVFWRAGLLNYHYSIISFNQKGVFIDKRVIAGIYTDGDNITQSIATIQPNMQILIASGQTKDLSGQSFEAASATTYQLEIKLDGTIGNL